MHYTRRAVERRVIRRHMTIEITPDAIIHAIPPASQRPHGPPISDSAAAPPSRSPPGTPMSVPRFRMSEKEASRIATNLQS
jgi:hypothetical protein